MRRRKYYLVIAIAFGILCGAVFGEVELRPMDGEPVLLGQPEPALVGIRQLYIVMLVPDSEPNKGGPAWKDLEEIVRSKVSQAGIKISQAIQHEHVLRSLVIPELRVNINMLKIECPQQYIFHVETSLAKKVYLTRDATQYIKADLWKTGPIMRMVSEDDMPAAVSSAVLEQTEAFIHSYLAANPPNKRRLYLSDINAAPEEQLKPAVKSTPIEYVYVASKNSNVFHKPECSSVKRIKPENLVSYSSRDEAISAGKRPCKRCNP